VCDRVTVIDRGRSVATGSLSELLESRATVKFKIGGLPNGWWTSVTDFGRWSREGEWIRLDCSRSGVVPDVVSAIVARGGRVEAVVPEHQTLERLFLELLEKDDPSGRDDPPEGS
jgi:ABC-2 type transport system ATP-binding protein